MKMFVLVPRHFQRTHSHLFPSSISDYSLTKNRLIHQKRTPVLDYLGLSKHIHRTEIHKIGPTSIWPFNAHTARHQHSEKLPLQTMDITYAFIGCSLERKCGSSTDIVHVLNQLPVPTELSFLRDVLFTISG